MHLCMDIGHTNSVYETLTIGQYFFFVIKHIIFYEDRTRPTYSYFYTLYD